MNDYSALHALYLLSDYPLLAELARGRTSATRLDGRTCRWIYEAGFPGVDWLAVSASELVFIRSLGIAPPP